MSVDDLSHHALFLDIDGTLIDIAPTPDGVLIPTGLAKLLDALAMRMQGALAILTGRTIAEVDRFLAPLRPIAAGVHGSEMRTAPGGAVVLRAEPIDARIVQAVSLLVRQEPGVIVEEKCASVAVHYRLANVEEESIERALQAILDEGPDHLILSRGRKVLEIVPRWVSKGAALETFMSQPVFRGRHPIMIGDDLADICAFEAAERMGGLGLRVAGEQFKSGDANFDSPAAVRAWLELLAERCP